MSYPQHPVPPYVFSVSLPPIPPTPANRVPGRHPVADVRVALRERASVQIASETWLSLACAAVAQDQLAQALSCLSRALAIDPASPVALVLAALTHDRAGSRSAAVSAASASLSLAPSADAWAASALALLHTSDLDAAACSIAAAMKLLGPAPPPPWPHPGDDSGHVQDTACLMPRPLRASVVAPRFPRLLSSPPPPASSSASSAAAMLSPPLSTSSTSASSTTVAAAAATTTATAAATAPTATATATPMPGATSFPSHNCRHSTSSFDLLPGPPLVWYAYGVVQRSLGQLDTAVDALHRVMILEDEAERASTASGFSFAPLAAAALAQVYHCCGARDDAIAWCRRAVVLLSSLPSHLPQLCSLAQLQLQYEQLDAALDTLIIAHTLQPDAPEPLVLRAEVLSRRGAHATVGEISQRLTTMKCPEHASYVRALCLRGTGQARAAIAAVHSAVAVAPDNTSAWVLLGCLHRESGAQAAALAAWERSLQLDSTNAEVWIMVGDLYRECMQVQDAADAYSRAVALVQDPRAYRALEEMQSLDQREAEEAGSILTSLFQSCKPVRPQAKWFPGA